MSFINFDAENRLGKEAINTDFVLRAYYDATTSETIFSLTFEGEVSKIYRDSKAVDLYNHIRSLPNFLEVPRDESGKAFDLVNLNYALHLFYRDKADSEDGEALLIIEYGMSDEIIGPRNTASRTLTSSGMSIVLRGDKAEEVWNKHRGAAL